MQKHVKNYFKAHPNLSNADNIPCEACGAIAVDVHHIIFKSHGGGNEADNLIALCRTCHSKAHSNKKFNESLKREKYIA